MIHGWFKWVACLDVVLGQTHRPRAKPDVSTLTNLATPAILIKTFNPLAQLNAMSGEYVYNHVRTAMRHIDKGTPETQKELLRAMIENIIVHDDQVEMNLIIEPSLMQEALLIPSPKEETPTPTNKGQDEGFLHQNEPTVAPPAGDSYWRQLWGVLTEQSAYFSLLINLLLAHSLNPMPDLKTDLCFKPLPSTQHFLSMSSPPTDLIVVI